MTSLRIQLDSLARFLISVSLVWLCFGDFGGFLVFGRLLVVGCWHAACTGIGIGIGFELALALALALAFASAPRLIGLSIDIYLYCNPMHSGF